MRKQECQYRDTIIRTEQIVKEIQQDITEIKKDLRKFIESADRKYARQEDFVFWRNLLISGIILSSFTGVLFLLIA